MAGRIASGPGPGRTRPGLNLAARYNSLKIEVVNLNSPLSAIESQLDAAIATGAFLVLYGHGLVGAGDGWDPTPVDSFQAVLELLSARKSRLWFVSLDEGARWIDSIAGPRTGGTRILAGLLCWIGSVALSTVFCFCPRWPHEVTDI